MEGRAIGTKNMIKEALRPWYRGLLRRLGLTPMQKALVAIRRRGYDPGAMNCLEVFGGTGDIHLMDYAYLTRALTIWEIDPAAAELLRKRFPKAAVQVVDSYEIVHRHPVRYELIVIDNPMSTYGPWCEHFSLFPTVFRLCTDRAVMMVAVTPEIDAQARAAYPYIFNPEQLRERRNFYRTDDPEHVSFETMAEIYTEHAKSMDLTVDWWLTQQRTHMYYFILGLSRKPTH